MIRIIEEDSILIAEDRLRLFKGDSVFLLVCLIFDVVPFIFHNGITIIIIQLYHTYVKQKGVSAEKFW